MLSDQLPSLTPSFVSETIRGIERFVQTLAFWTATLLPMSYLPLLLVAPTRFASLPLLGKLVSLNVIALVLGHGYRNESERPE